MTYADTEDLSDYPDEREAETEEERKKREEEERAAEAAAAARAESAAQARALSAQMAVEEARVAQPPPVLAQPTVSSISQGRMYMGPNVPDAALSQLVKPGEAVSYYAPDVRPTVAPPPSVDEWRQSELQRLQAADVPGRSRTIAISPPEAMPVEAAALNAGAAIAEDRFAAVQEWKRRLAAGEDRTNVTLEVGPRIVAGMAPGATEKAYSAMLGTQSGRGATTAGTSTIGPLDKSDYEAMQKRLDTLNRSWIQTRKELADARMGGTTALQSAKASLLESIRKQIEKQKSEMDEFKARFRQPATPGQPAAPSPYPEGAIVRNKSTGRSYRIVNGRPVPM